MIARLAPALHNPIREAYRYLRFLAGLPHEVDFAIFRDIPDQPGLFIDAGANGGISALSFACMNARYRIHSFEPNPSLSGELDRARRLLGKRFSYDLCALGEESRQIQLFVPIREGISVTSEATLMREVLEAPETRARIGGAFEVVSEMIPVARLDEFGLCPDILKVDVQGWELAVLRGARETIIRSSPLLMVEDNWATADVMAYLTPLGYQFYRFDPDANRLIAWVTEWPSPNYFALHSQRRANWLEEKTRPAGL